MFKNLISLFLLVLIGAFAVTAQSTAFTYQGSLSSSGNQANGIFDFEFRLFDAPENGSLLGAVQTRNAVQVSNGVFNVELDFGPQFPGAARYLEIRVRSTGSGGHTILAPRHPFTSTPYAMTSLNAAYATSADNAATATTATNALQLGGVAANQYVLTGDVRLSDSRQPSAGSPNYIQNQDAESQASSNFNISGTGRASVFDASSRFAINNQHVLSVGVQNVFLGSETGTSTTGFLNTFLGWSTGKVTGLGGANTFVGARAGRDNTAGANNTFAGADAGTSNVSGNSNAFFGRSAGILNSDGSGNAFFGQNTGTTTTTGSNNTFVGTAAGSGNQTGSNNSVFGAAASLVGSGLSFATAIGSGSTVSTSNSLVLGRSADTVRVPGGLNLSGSLNVSGGTVANAFSATSIGVGTASPTKPLQVVGEILSSGSQAGYLFSDRTTPSSQWLLYSNGFSARLLLGGVDKLAISATGILSTANLAGGTSTHACWNTGTGEFANCSSSIRYKSDVIDFSTGLEVVRRLRPVSFAWKATGRREIGLIAEEAAEVEPLLTYRNKDGEIEGVNYDQVSVVLVNAVKAQQSQIDRLENEIKLLRSIICELIPVTTTCR